MFFNTVGFLLSLTTIFELIIRAGNSWFTIMIMTFAYTFSDVIVSPAEMYKSVNLVIFVTAIVWAVGISFLHVLPYKVQSKLLGVIPVWLDVLSHALPTLAAIYKRAADSDSPPSTPTVQSAGDTASPPIGAVSQNDSRIVLIKE
ncbi:hypothetical protein RHGRI_000392 [Rhododendron griersonianum]|uniref:Uncharacterized protein n=1 Tax=Rhododendron griersonianum TaxID=479676 RepID=A0AAV6LHA6_9ERIC|nr:hypothetical protein RHGRI_000392 [Rhododendron griersonianum]